MNAPTSPRKPPILHSLGKAAAPASILAVLVLLALPATVAGAAQDTAAQDTAFVFNTFSFLIWGALVMWMCAGFTMLESGSVRSKNASVICLKNIGLYAIAGLTYYIVGYNLMYTGVDGGFMGALDWFYGPSADEIALLGGDEGAAAAVVDNGYAVTSDWFFQMVFVATTASIVSGALAERVNLWAFFAFTAILTTVIYPIVGAWTWGSGWLGEMGFTDFAGSTIVHSTGGWAALAGAIVGLVAITAGPNIIDGRWAIVIGAVGALLCTLGLKILERARIDDVVGAVPAHLFAGVWGTLAASIAAGADFVTQLIGVVSIGAFVFTVSWVVWTVLEKTMGVRVSRSVEEIGQDAAELGIDAYPEFILMVDPDDGGDYRDPD